MTMDEIVGIIGIVVACLVVLASIAMTVADTRAGRPPEVMEVVEGFSVLVLYGVFAWVVSVAITGIIYGYLTNL